ncbi:MAG: hypothetical protein NVS1B4_02760 [Gemmatimonadaceae bacterium]
MHGMDAVDHFTRGLRRPGQMVCDVNASDDEDVVVRRLDLATRLGREFPFARIDLARLQRAPEGAE